MVRVREIPRTAAFAWSPGAANLSVVTGTKAGAVDADFSSETQLELWDLNLEAHDNGVERQPVISIGVDSRFHDLAWNQPSDNHTQGIIAGALDSGALDLWDAAKLRKDSANAHISRTSKHSGAIKSLQFNPFRHELLATSGTKGELYITDINNVSSPFRLGTAVARADDFDAIDWNKKVSHILATGSSGGFVTVWDVKGKKESLTIKNDPNNSGRKAVSAIAWDPEVPTKLATATSNDLNPLILMWDLRNANAPERILQGHDQGILSLAWSAQDPRLLLSCGKDNRTICWNSRTGEAFGEFPLVTNWTFQTKWNSAQPSLIATASFDGKIAVHTIQNTNVDTSQSAAAASALDGADFFAQAQSQPQGAAFSLPTAPKWLERPVGATFGFGGKLITFGLTDFSSRASKITICPFVIDPMIGDASQSFEDILVNGDMVSFCEGKISSADNEEERADWTVIETLISGSRKKLVAYLGFARSESGAKGDSGAQESTQTNGTTKAATFFDDETEGAFLSSLASTKGVRTNNPFQIYTGSETQADRSITRALVLGEFEEALDVCLQEDRLSDAFMIAICGGQKCIDKAQQAYFKRQGDGPNYLRLLASVVGKNLWDVVYNADLTNWKEVLATLCTFAEIKEFPDLCEALGDRLEESLQDGGGVARKDASLCYLAGSKLEKVVGNWAQELQENEKAVLEAAERDSLFSIHATALQKFVEKVTIFRQVAKFEDMDASKTTDWKLEPLYAKYIEYADIMASHGKLKIAERYLDLLPAQYPAAEAAKTRVKMATHKSAAATNQRHIGSGQRGQRNVPMYAPTQPVAAPGPVSAASSSTPVGGMQPSVQSVPIQPPVRQSAYAPIGFQEPQQQKHYQTKGFQSNNSSLPFGGYQQQQYGTIPPPQASQPPQRLSPAAKQRDLQQWNDLPTEFGVKAKPAPRRGTPGLTNPPASSPYTNVGQGIAPPPAAPFSSQQRATPPVAPPPKAGALRLSSPPLPGFPQLQEQQRPSSSATNNYSPSPATQAFPTPQQPQVPRGTSPYNVPPPSGLTNNRYAPTQGSQPSPSQGGPGPSLPGRHIAPPPTGSSYVPSPYGQPQTQIALPPVSHAPPPPPPKGFGHASTPSPGTPLPGRVRGISSVANQLPPPDHSISRPGTAEAEGERGPPAPAQPRYPPGDRSHIPPVSQPIFRILGSEMARVKARAPAQFRAQVLDAEKRLNILFDHLNNEDLLRSDTVEEMVELSSAIERREHDRAQALFTDIMTRKTEQGSTWMVGVKRLIQMSRATPV